MRKDKTLQTKVTLNVKQQFYTGCPISNNEVCTVDIIIQNVKKKVICC